VALEERMMSLTTHTITNTELQQQVEEELRWGPAVAPASVGVTAEDHTITLLLTGSVASWSERDIAEHAAWSAPFVTKVTDDLVIR
jgi:osmotically-inducible protein OsmY